MIVFWTILCIFYMCCGCFFVVSLGQTSNDTRKNHFVRRLKSEHQQGIEIIKQKLSNMQNENEKQKLELTNLQNEKDKQKSAYESKIQFEIEQAQEMESEHKRKLVEQDDAIRKEYLKDFNKLKSKHTKVKKKMKHMEKKMKDTIIQQKSEIDKKTVQIRKHKKIKEMKQQINAKEKQIRQMKADWTNKDEQHKKHLSRVDQQIRERDEFIEIAYDKYAQLSYQFNHNLRVAEKQAETLTKLRIENAKLRTQAKNEKLRAQRIKMDKTKNMSDNDFV